MQNKSKTLMRNAQNNLKNHSLTFSLENENFIDYRSFKMKDRQCL